MLVIPGGKTIFVRKFHMEILERKVERRGEKISEGEFHMEMREHVGNSEWKNDFRGNYQTYAIF